MTIQSVHTHYGQIAVYVNGVWSSWSMPSEPAGGKPGVGGYGTTAGNSISQVQFGPLDRVAATPTPAASIASTAFPNRVEMQWPGVVDDANGSGC